ncbi:PIN domain-containing protein [Chloroflexi bacterium TSY]|nr:PIN domain-containing protein [Chloroflexi bacterium TSY]
MIAGAFSQRGASYILLQLSNLTIINGIISPDVRFEAERNIQRKAPSALPALRILLKESLLESPPPSISDLLAVKSFADRKDRHILAAAHSQKCEYFVTLNVKDFWPPPSVLKIVRPGSLLQELRIRIVNDQAEKD